MIPWWTYFLFLFFEVFWTPLTHPKKKKYKKEKPLISYSRSWWVTHQRSISWLALPLVLGNEGGPNKTQLKN